MVYQGIVQPIRAFVCAGELKAELMAGLTD
jgi:hypothetical protein